MNHKQIFSSFLCLGLIIVFSGCDWCTCMKKAPAAPQETKIPEAQHLEAKTAEPTPPSAPKMIEPALPKAMPMPTPMPVEPKVAPMPIEPMPEAKIPEAKIA